MENIMLDPNQVVKKEEGREDTVWYDVTAQPFDLYGYDRGENDLLSCRIPEKAAERISRGIHKTRAYGVGGRVRFGTDSPYILLRVEFGEGVMTTITSFCTSYGFDLYTCDESGQESFRHLFRVPDGFDQKTYISSYDSHNHSGFMYYTLNVSRNAEVKKIYIGLKENSKLTKGVPYVNAKPIIYYGSSITFGSGSSRPGNTYQGFISQKYNLDYVNLGFAGKAKGEPEMAEYIAGREMEAFVCDYDHNAKRAEHLRNTHYRFYEIIREKHPTLPYIMISGPDTRRNFDPTEFDSWEDRRAVIIESYERAKAAGDENVYFIDGETLLAGDHVMSCTVDGGHPNDLGYYRMAKVIGDHLEKILKL